MLVMLMLTQLPEKTYTSNRAATLMVIKKYFMEEEEEEEEKQNPQRSKHPKVSLMSKQQTCFNKPVLSPCYISLCNCTTTYYRHWFVMGC